MRHGGRAAAVGGILCGALAIASKEVGLVLPVVVLAYDWLLRPGDPAARRRRFWRVFAPAFILLAAVGVYRVLAMGGLSRDAAAAPALNLLTQSIVIWRYIGLLVWPSGQSIMHARASGDLSAGSDRLGRSRGPCGCMPRRVSTTLDRTLLSHSVSSGFSPCSPRRPASSSFGKGWLSIVYTWPSAGLFLCLPRSSADRWSGNRGRHEACGAAALSHLRRWSRCSSC